MRIHTRTPPSILTIFLFNEQHEDYRSERTSEKFAVHVAYSDLYCTECDNFSPKMHKKSLASGSELLRLRPDPGEGAYKTTSPARPPLAVIGERWERGEK